MRAYLREIDADARLGDIGVVLPVPWHIVFAQVTRTTYSDPVLRASVVARSTAGVVIVEPDTINAHPIGVADIDVLQGGARRYV